MEKIKRITLLLLIVLLFYTRFIGLPWGLPYAFHPDERNMAMALERLDCQNLIDLKNCFNPHFFAYGQFPLYLGYGVVYGMKVFDGDLNTPVDFQEATIALRLISALASVLLTYFAVRIVQLLNNGKKRDFLLFVALLLLIFSPALIQFAHFGTTESLLMLFYTWLIYESLLFANKKIKPRHFLLISSLVSGLAIATKVSSLVFALVPVVAILLVQRKKVGKALGALTLYGLLTLLIGIDFSPHNLLSLNEFLGAFRYESEVALGTLPVFYTRQFTETIPVIFQFLKVFPYALGLPVLLLFLIGFFSLPVNKNYNFLRAAFLIYFLPSAFLYAKWTRFMAPIMPMMIVFAVLTLTSIFNAILSLRGVERRRNLKRNYFSPLVMTTLAVLTTLIIIIPGLAYFSIYRQPDVRVGASTWIDQNIESESFILSETANVVDIPVKGPGSLKVISFNFYDLDVSSVLQQELQQHLQQADYIYVPSRRIFMNNPKEKYPRLNNYYAKLFSGELGFKKVAEFSSYPKISFLGKTLLEFPDEQAEETWTVFDHPVVRIYKRSEKL